MKKLLILFSMLLTVAGFVSCKNESDINTAPTLEVTKTSAMKKAEPITFSFKTTADPSKIRWTVSPEANVSIVPDGQTATILFKNSGRYSVTATDVVKIAKIDVNVNNENYFTADNTGEDFVPLPGDELEVTPMLDDTASTGILISIRTTKQYPCGEILSSAASNHNFVYNSDKSFMQLAIKQFTKTSACISPNENVGVTTQMPRPLDGQSIKFEIKFNNAVYRGSVAVQGGKYLFTWPYTTGIKFTNLIARDFSK